MAKKAKAESKTTELVEVSFQYQADKGTETVSDIISTLAEMFDNIKSIRVSKHGAYCGDY